MSLQLVPPLYEEGGLDDFLKSGQTLSFAISPRTDSLAIYASPLQLVPSNSASRVVSQQDVYTAAWHKPPVAERRIFVSDTSVIFAACRKLIEHVTSNGQQLMRSISSIVAFRKLVGDYIIHLQDCWVHSTQLESSPEGPSQFTGDHYKSLYRTMSLFQALYLPEDGEEDVPVGDELLEWLNTHYIEPSSEEGDHLSSLERPWEDEFFWTYLIRATLRGLLKSSVFFLKALLNHPSEYLELIASKLIDILERHPRQKQFATEKEFLIQSRRWKDKVKVLRIELDRVSEADRNDGFGNWWDEVSDLLGILEGRADVLQAVCAELGGSWKEVICAYGVWIDVGLRRAELPDIAEMILSALPPDPTNKEDAMHAFLVQGRPGKVLTIAHDVDVWFSAHLVDIMVHLGLLDSDIDEESSLSIRDMYVLAYADYLQSDPGLWRLTVDYLCTCGEIGKEMADEILMRVPLDTLSEPASRVKDQKENTMEIDQANQIEDASLSGIIKELSETCFEYQREESRRMICRIAARKLVKLKNYGLAVSYCRSAEDWTGLGYIVDSLLEEYIRHGPSRYISLVSSISTSLQELLAECGPYRVFVNRLMFAVRYAEFHQSKFQGDVENSAIELASLIEEDDIAPRAWWGVLLYDSISFVQDEEHLFFPPDTITLLMKRLEEISLRTSYGCGDDYLEILSRILKVGGPKEALRRLDVLRLALARYLARWTLVDPYMTKDI